MNTELTELKKKLSNDEYVGHLVSNILKKDERDATSRKKVLNLIYDAVNAISSIRGFNVDEVIRNITSYKNIISTSISLNMPLNPFLGLATIIKFKEIPTLLITYKGLLNIINQDPRFEKISADVIYEGEKYEVIKGTEEKFIHIPDYIKGGRATNDKKASNDLIIGAYAVAKFKDANYFEVMSREQINQIRDSSANYKYSKNKDSCIWSMWYDEMAKKTALRRLIKYLNVGNDNEQLTRTYSTALAVDNAQYENKMVVVNEEGNIETKEMEGNSKITNLATFEEE